MDWLTIEVLRTIAGASLAVTILTAAIKAIGCTSGRITQLSALGVSLVIAFATQIPTDFKSGLVTFLNGLVIFAAATGIDQTVNLEKREA